MRDTTQAVPSPGPPDGALLRLAIAGGRWAEDLPPVPRGRVVTVTLSSATAADEHGEALALLGYRLAGVSPRPSDATVAEVLVPQAVIEAHPRFWRSLADRAEQAFSLAHGPVLARLDAELRVHLAARRRAG